jgi:hypothetical protein
MRTPYAYLHAMKLPTTIREQFRTHGRAGGKARAARMTSADRSRASRLAALRRWTAQRFGSASFAALGLPGGEEMDRGITDLAWGRESVESLVVSLAAPRLQREGVPLPREFHADPENRLYRRLEQESAELAHARYLAHLQQAASFADACRLFRRDENAHAA